MLKTLLIDNYDSFTYNLYQYLGELNANPLIYRNNEIFIEDIKHIEPTHIVLSPGPGTVKNKEDFGICNEIITQINKPILGVCLGHQGIIYEFGGEITQAKQIIHGMQSTIKHNNTSKLFKNIPETFEAMRYHSLIGTNLSKKLKITATLNNDPATIMAVEHIKKPIFGIQFHPESIGTPYGRQILANFLKIK